MKSIEYGSWFMVHGSWFSNINQRPETRDPKKEQDRGQGFLLLEVILAMAIISLAMAPIAQNITDSLKIGSDGNKLAQNYYLAQGKMEEILAQDFDTLANAGGTQIMGVNIPWQVSVSLYDGDGDSTPDPDLKRVLLQVGEIKLETLRFRML